MWELAAISAVVLLLVLILLIVTCWISANNANSRNRRQIYLLESRLETGLANLQAAQTICCTKAFLTVVGGVNGAVSRTMGTETGLLKVVTWDAQAVNQLPDSGWVPVYSTIDNSLIGWTVPLNGTYFVEYETAISTGVALGLLLVNGQLLQRSLSGFTSALTSPQVVSEQLHKSFLVNLQKGDIVSLIILNLSGPGVTPPLETGGPGRFMHTLTMDLRDASSQSSDTGVDATPPVLLGIAMEPEAAPKSLTDGKSDATTATGQVKSAVHAQNVEQWLAAPPVHEAVRKAVTAAASGRTAPECADTLFQHLAPKRA